MLTSYSLVSAVAAYEASANQVASSSNNSILTTLVGEQLGLSAPLINQTLDQVLSLSSNLQTPFSSTASAIGSEPQGNTDAQYWTTVVAPAFANAGFTITQAYTGSPDAHGNLFQVSFTKTTSASLPSLFAVPSQQLLGAFFGANNNGLSGPMSGSGSVTVSITMGVDYNASSSNPYGFFIAPSQNLVSANMTATAGSGAISGVVSIGSLATVNVSASGGLSLTGQLGLQPTAADTDGKVRVSDLTGSPAQVVSGGLSGTASLSASLDAQVFSLPDISWTGSYSQSIQGGSLQSPVVNMQYPSVSSILNSMAPAVFSIGDQLPMLGPIMSTLNQPLPLIDESIAQLTGLDDELPDLPSEPSNLSSVDGSSEDLAGGTLTVNVTPSSIAQFLTGQTVTLISWTTSGSVPLVDEHLAIPIYTFGVPDIASADVDLTFGVDASLNYNLGFGFGSTAAGQGVFIDAGTAQDPTLGLTLKLSGGIEGVGEIFGFPLVTLGGSVGVAVTPYVTITSPDNKGGPVFMSQFAAFGSDPVNDLFDSLSYGIEADLVGELDASVDLFFYSDSWKWDLSISIFNTEQVAEWPPAPTPQAGAALSLLNSMVTLSGPSNGVLNFNGTSKTDNVQLSETSNKAVVVTWNGVSSQPMSGITQVNFNGGGGNDHLSTSPGFNVPIYAVATGNDYLEGGAANSTLIGGAGNDTLVAGSGNTTIIGGSGNEMLVGGAGHDLITAGGGTDVITGGRGNSTLNAGPGNDTINAGSGNDLINDLSTGASYAGTYYISGGSGSDTINGGSGFFDSIYGGSGGHNLITGSSAGYNLIYGGGPADTIYGGVGGYDTIYGSAGSNPYATAPTNNWLQGGSAGYNLIFGGGSGDQLFGMAGNNTLYAGSGNETLYGGDGVGLQPNSLNSGLLSNAAGDGLTAGNNLLIAGSSSGNSPATSASSASNGQTNSFTPPIANDVLYGDSTGNNTLIGGGGNDTLYAGSGSDFLNAGYGGQVSNGQQRKVAMYGGPGNVAFQLPFTPAGQMQPSYTIVGGPSVNTLLIKPTIGSGAAAPEVLTQAIADATSTTVNVTSQAALAESGLSAGSIISVDHEQMLITAINGAQLTVTRGYNGTTPTAHAANCSIALVVAQGAVKANAIANANTTSFTVTSLAALTGSGYAVGSTILIDQEQMLITAVSGTTLTVARGYNGTIAVAHNANAPVLPGPGNYKIYLTQGAANNQYQATLSNLVFGNVTLGSNSITNLASTQGMNVGDPVTGDGIPAGTTIASIASANSIVLSAPATLTKSNATLSVGVLGQLAITMPSTVPNIDVEAGAGDNWIQVDPSVARAMSIFGGAGLNTLMAGSGNDTLAAGSGTAVLYGGSGDDLMYGGDLPSQDVSQTLDAFGTVTSIAQAEGNDTLIAGSGNSQLFGGKGNDVLIGGSVAQQVGANNVAGLALLQNGQYQLVDGAGRDILFGGSGNNLIIAGPGGPGSLLQADGSGNDTLLADNNGLNVFRILSSDTGANLMIGGNLTNVFADSGFGDDTLVGGVGLNTLLAGSGSDSLYASDPAAWVQATSAAANDGISLIPPTVFEGDALATAINALLNDPQPLSMTNEATLQSDLVEENQALFAQQTVVENELIAITNSLSSGTVAANKNVLTGLPSTAGLLPGDGVVGNNLPAGTAITAILSNTSVQLSAVAIGSQANEPLTIVTPPANLSPAANALYGPLNNQLQYLLTQQLVVAAYLAPKGTSLQADSLLGGAGADVFYGNPSLATHMAGGPNNDTFYSYQSADSISGGGGVDALILTGDGAITVNVDPNNASALQVAIPGQNSGMPWEVGNTDNISGIKVIGVATGAGNDSVTIGTAASPLTTAGLAGVAVTAGSGNVTIDSTYDYLPETLTAGSGNDVIKVSTKNLATQTINGSAIGSTEVDIEDTDGSAVSVNAGFLKVDNFTGGVSGVGTNISKLVVAGDSATNTFSTDGTIPSVVFQGGSGAGVVNSFTGTGSESANVTMVGGNGASNSFAINGPGAYTIVGGSGAGVTNALNISTSFSDVLGEGDQVYLSQANSATGPIAMSGDLSGTATNITAVSLTGINEDDYLDAAGMIMPVTLKGFYQSTLIGGAGNDTLYYDYVNNIAAGSFDGGDGANTLVYQTIYTNDSQEAISFTAATVSASPVLIDNTNDQYGDITEITFSNVRNVESLQITGNPGSVNGKQQFVWSMDSSQIAQIPLISAGLVSGAPSAAFVDTFYDNNYDASGDAGTFYWDNSGVGNSNLNSSDVIFGTIPQPQPPIYQSYGVFVAYHIFPTRGSHTITGEVVDSAGAESKVTTTFSGGLELDGGTLNLYDDDNSTSQMVDSSVSQYVVDTRNDILYLLYTDKSVWSIDSSGNKTKIDTGVSSIAVIQNAGGIAELKGNSIYAYFKGDSAPYLFLNGVSAILNDASNNIVALLSNGVVEVTTPDDPEDLPQVLSNVQSITNGGAGVVEALTNDGNEYLINGLTSTFVAGPQFSPKIGAATAGQPTTVTFLVTDPIAGDYLGNVAFASSDAAAITAYGQLPSHSLTTADNNQFSFQTTFLTAGVQSITVTLPNGATVSQSVTVLPAAAASFGVSFASLSATAGASSSIRVTAYDVYGNVATGYTGTVSFASTDQNSKVSLPGSYTFTAGDNGIHTFSTLTLYTAGAQTVTAVDTANGIKSSGSLDVTPAAFNLADSTITLSAATVGTAGAPINLTFTARDAYGNQLTTGGLNVGFGLLTTGGASAIGVISPSPYALDNGNGTYSATLLGSTAGSYLVDVVVGGNSTYHLSIDPTVSIYQTLSITTGLSTTFTENVSGSFTPAATSAFTPSWSESGSLPAGLSFNSVTGAITGKPALGSAGTYLITLKASSSGQAATQSFTINVNQNVFAVVDGGAGYTQPSGSWIASSLLGYNSVAAQASASSGAVAMWSPSGLSQPLTAGYYAVTFYNVVDPSGSSSAQITVVANGVTSSPLLISQSSGSSGFVSLGTFYFAGTAAEHVSLTQLGSGKLLASVVVFTQVPVDQAPTVTAPGAQTTTQNLPITFSTAGGNAISVGDPDGSNSVEQLTLSTTNGTLALSTISGLAFVSGNNGQASFSVQGTLAALDAALAGLVYSPAPNYAGVSPLQVAINDLSSFGKGPLTVSATVPITVKYPNSTIVDSQAGYTEPSGTWSTSTVVGYNGVATHLSSSSNAVATWTPTLANSGNYAVYFYNPAKAGASTDVTVTVVHSGVSSVFTVNEAIGTPGFINLGNFAFAGSGNEYVSISQGTTAGALYASAVEFFGEETAPSITVPSPQSTIISSPVVFSTATSNAISISAPGVGNNTVQLALGASNGIVTLATTSGLTITAGANGSAACTIQGTLTAVNGALAGLKFTPGANYAGATSLSLTFNDLGVGGAGPAQIISQTVSILAKFRVVALVEKGGYSESAGTWTTSTVIGAGVASRTTTSSPATATWTPTLVPGEYQVMFYDPATAGASTDALVMVKHNGGTNTYTINEASGTPGYVSLGSFYFSGAGNEYISISQGTTAGTLYASGVEFLGEEITPSITVPAAQSTPINTTLTFSSATSNSISITAANAGSNPVQLALSCVNGSLALGTAAGLTFTAGANGSASMTMQGTLSAINAALAGMKFTPSTNIAGAASLSLSFNDLGVGGAGPAQIISQTLSIVIKYPNVTIVDQGSGYSETAGTWTTSTVTGAGGAAMRTTTSSPATATWTPPLKAGEYQVLFYNPAAAGASTDALVSVRHNGNVSTYTVNEASGTAGYIVLGSLYFAGTGNEYASISQGATVGTLYASAVEFLGEEVPPSVTVPAAQSTTLNTPLMFSSATSNAISITAGNIGSNPVQVSLAAANGALALATTSGLTFTSGANNSAAMTIQGTLTAVNAAIAGLKFTPTANVAGAATLSLNFSDLGVGGAGVVQTVSKTIPILIKYLGVTIVDQASGYSESVGTWTTSTVTGAGGAATRTTTSSPATATWTPTLKAGEYQVLFYNPATAGASTDAVVSVRHNGGVSTFTVNEASGTAGYINLGSLYFAGTGNEYVSISQGTTVGTLYASAVEFLGEEVPPSVTVPAAQSATVNTPLTFSSATSNAISITAANVGNNPVQLALSSVNGSLTLATTSGLTFTSGSNNSAAITVQGTLTAVNAAIAGLNFNPAANIAGPASFSLTFSDLGVGGAGVVQTVSKTIPILIKYLSATIVDQASGYSESAGTWTTSTVTGAGGAATRTTTSSLATATWTPTLKAGEYQVLFYNPATAGASTDAVVSVKHNGGVSTFTVNEASGTAGYISLGSLYFAGNGNEYASISQGATVGTLYASAVEFLGEEIPPSVAVPAAQSATLNTSLTFSSATSNAISITAANVGSNPVQLALSSVNGSLTLATISGLTFTSGANNSAAMTVQGTLAALNAAIAGLKFAPSANLAGAASLSLIFSDLGVGGAGVVQTVSKTISILVKYPSVTIVDQAGGYGESAGIWTTSTVTGAGGAATRTTASSPATATWTPTLAGGEYQVMFYNPVTAGASTDALVTVAHNGLTSTFTINEASGTAGYVNLGSFLFAGTGNEYVRISQGAVAGTLYASAVQFAGQGNAPTMNVPPAQSTPVNSPLVFSTANNNAISIADTSAGVNPVQLALSVTNGTLLLAATTGLTFTSGSNGATSFTVQGTLAAINAALNGLKFTPTTGYAGASTLTLNFNDLGIGGAGPVQTLSKTVSISV